MQDRPIRAELDERPILTETRPIFREQRPTHGEPRAPVRGDDGSARLPAKGPTVGSTITAVGPGRPVRSVRPFGPTRRRLAMTALAATVLFVVTYAVLIRTRDGQLLDGLAYRGREAIPGRYQSLSNHILASVEVATVAIVCVALLLTGVVRRIVWRGLCAAGGFGIAIVASQILKPALPRPELIGASLEYGFATFNTYPSGHTTIFTSAALAAVLLASRNARPLVALVAAVVATGASTGVLISGWHRGSDAIGAVFLSLLVMSVAALVALPGERNRFANDDPQAPANWRRDRWTGPLWLAVAAVAATLAGLWLVILFWRNTWMLADAWFGIMASVIVIVTWVGVIGFAGAVRDLR